MDPDCRIAVTKTEPAPAEKVSMLEVVYGGLRRTCLGSRLGQLTLELIDAVDGVHEALDRGVEGRRVRVVRSHACSTSRPGRGLW